jgi:hypothetical protein
LVTGVAQDYHEKVFVDNLEASLTSVHRDTIQSCNSSHHANELLSLYNPQDGEETPPRSNQKCFRPSVISYTAAAAGSIASSSSPATTVAQTSSSPNPTQQFTSISSLMDSDIDKLYECLKHYVDTGDDSSPGITSEEMEKIVNELNNNLLQVREEMRTSVAALTAQVDNINTAVKKQNVVVVGLQKTLEATSKDLKDSVNQQVADLSSQIQGLRNLVLSLLPPSALQAETQLVGQAGT